jgi:DNA-binding response OmpR family regulator
VCYHPRGVGVHAWRGQTGYPTVAVTETILLVEDDAKLGAQVVGYLEEAGFSVTWIQDGDRARAVDPSQYALIVLDLMLPGAYGMDLLKRWRETSGVPVLILSARDHTADKVRGLELGADDYLTKPFWPGELMARVQARLRRPVLGRTQVVRSGPLAVDLAARRVEVDGAPVGLTPAELGILMVLAERAGAAISRTELVDAVLDAANPSAERTLDVHVSRLRKKLGAAGERVATVWGIGYRLESE